MSKKNSFHVPTVEEMESLASKDHQVKPLFGSHQGFLSRSGTNKTSTKSSTNTQQQGADMKKQPSSSKVTLQESISADGTSKDVLSKSSSQTLMSSNATTQKSNQYLKNPRDNATSSEDRQLSHNSKKPEAHSTASGKDDTFVKPTRTEEAEADGMQIAPGSKPSKTNSIIVSARQRGNPILKHVRNVAWEFGDIVPDYQLGQTSCALFLSLRYHHLNPNYIHERLKQLAHSYTLRVVLVHVDVKDPHHALQELASICILADCTLMTAFSAEEAGRYLETYKAFENKPPDLIMEKTEGSYLARFTDTLTAVKKVNKTDAATLLSTFGTFEKICKATEEDLSLCPGFGPQKAQRLHAVLREPFLKSKKRSVPIGKSPVKGPTDRKIPKQDTNT